MQHALKRWEKGEVAIVPILVSPVDYSDTPISRLQMLPTEGRAITRWADRERAYANVAAGIRQVVYRLHAQKLKLQGDAYCGQETYDDALDAYNKALRLDPKNPPFYCAQGKALYHLQRFDEAIKAYLELSRVVMRNACPMQRALPVNDNGRSSKQRR
jgi:tetratricopeptide (TPR) repeat protein